MSTKNELLAELKANDKLGIAFNQSGTPLQTMTFHEFLQWYADCTPSLSTESVWNDDRGSYDHCLVESVNGRVLSKTKFDDESDCDQEYYDTLERRYNDDNGAGGIFYNNKEAIARLEDDNDEWQALLDKEPLYMVIQYTDRKGDLYMNAFGEFGLREYAMYWSEKEAKDRMNAEIDKWTEINLDRSGYDDKEQMRDYERRQVAKWYDIEEVEEDEE
jgi:hypothetical protein